MAKYWIKFKQMLPGFAGKKEPAEDAIALPQVKSYDERRANIEGQIAALEREIARLRQGVTADEKSDDNAVSFDLRQRLVRARDLRYKAYLLKAELNRSCSSEEDTPGFGDGGSQAESIQKLFGRKDSASLEELEDGIESPNYKVRLAALRGLYNVHGRGSAAACLKCLVDENPEVRRTAARFLGLLGLTETAGALAILLRDENADVRIAAAKSLESISSEQTVYMLIRALEDEEASVRASAKTALARTLSLHLDIDVDMAPTKLSSRIEALLKWWAEVRALGQPWSIPN